MIVDDPSPELNQLIKSQHRFT